MREIKFRAFSKEQQKFFPFSFETMYGYEGETCGVLIRKDGSYNGVQINFNSGYGFDGMNPDIEITQYTGLKDKNGVEIAIGDIVQDIDLEKEPYLVEEGDGMITAGGVWLNSFRASLMEVIGNIYSNPELINNKNI